MIRSLESLSDIPPSRNDIVMLIKVRHMSDVMKLRIWFGDRLASSGRKTSLRMLDKNLAALCFPWYVR